MPIICTEDLTNQVASRHPLSKEWGSWCKRYQGKYKEIKGPLSPISLPITPIIEVTNSKKFIFTV